MQQVQVFIAGMVTMGFVISGLFFFRFWIRTRDRLFAIFGIAFCLMAVNEIFTPPSVTAQNGFYYAYLLRIAAYLLLIAGIVAKNLEQRTIRRP